MLAALSTKTAKDRQPNNNKMSKIQQQQPAEESCSLSECISLFSELLLQFFLM